MSDSNNISINDDSSNNIDSNTSKISNSKDSKDMKRTDSDLDGKPSTDFGIKFRRVRACARCHRLKMRCVFEDPTFNSCKRCYAANIACSMTEDPTSSTAKTRTRRRLKAPLANLQNSMSEAFNFFQKVQEQLNDNTINKTNKKIFNNKDKHNDNDKDNDNDDDSDNDKDSDDNKDIITIPDSFEIDKLTQIQSQLFELQRLLSHVISSSKTAQNISPKSNVASSMSSMKDGPVKPVPHLPWIPYEYNIMKELFKLKILSPGISREKYNIFVNDILIYWPCISLPKDYNFDYLLEREPLILLGFIAVTCLNQPDLHDTLLYYLEGNLAQRVSISGDITVNLIQIYLVLSLWGSPPRKWGSYKHQMSLLTALDLSLCLDLGNEKFRDSSNVLKSNSEERKIIRAYIGVYTCCGSLGLSLPRFKVVSWTKNHEKCCNILLTGESNRQDKFLCYYARLISIGEEIFSFLCPDAIGGPNAMAFMNMNNANNNNTGNDIISNGPVTNTSWSHEHLRTMMIGYEKRMQKLAIESELLNHDSKERNLLSIIYYQLLMTMYDYVVCRVLMKRDVLNEVYIETLSRLIRASEKVIDSFVNLCDQTDYFPTFFYYRPMHALVALIRARLLVRSQRLDLEVNVEREYDRVCSSLDTISKKSLVANKMKAILSRVDKWMKVSNKFSKDGANSSMVTLLDELGKEKAIEVIKVTKTKKAAAAVAAAAAAATAAAGSSSSTLLTEISNSNTISANSKNAGDNGNLHPGAKAHFNKFIHHNFDSVSQMKRTHSTANQPSTGATTTTNNDGSSSTTTPIKSNKQQKKDSKHTPNSSSSASGATSTVLSTSTSSTSENSTPVKSVNNTSRGTNTTVVTPLSSRSNTNNKLYNNQSRSRSSNIDRSADSSQVQQQQPQQQQSQQSQQQQQQSQQQQNYQNFIPSPIGYTYSEYAPSPLMQTRSNSINAVNNGNNGNGNGGNGGNNRINKSVQNLSQLPSDQISQVRQDPITANQQQQPLQPPPPPQQQFEDTPFNSSDIPPQTPSNLLNDDHFTTKSLADIFMQIDSDIINFMASSNNNPNYSNIPQGDIPPSQFQQNYQQQQQNMDSGQQGNNSQSNLFNPNYIGDFQNIDNGFYQNEYNSNFMNYNNFSGNNNNEEGDGGLPPPPQQQQQQTAPQQGQPSQRQGPSEQLQNGEYFMVSQNTDNSSNNDNKNIFGEVEGYGFW
ncbi:binding protein [[Candida] boidinii]|nr:binding protein [[Candida] boidinii]